MWHANSYFPFHFIIRFIHRFTVQYLEALQYCLRRRNNVPPAVVNPRRMTQLPLPVVVVPVRVENPVIIADGEDGNEYEAIPADDENEPAPAIIVDAEVENANEEPIPENVVAEVENQREELIPENDEGAGSATQHATAAETAQIIVKAEVAIPVQSLAQLEIFCAAADPDCSSGIAVENIAIEPAAGTSSIGFAQPSVLETVDVDEIARVDDLRDIETDDSDSAIEPSTTESAATGENENHQCNESGENGAGIVADNIAIEPTTGTSTLNLAQLSILETVKGDTNGRDLNCDTVDDLSGNETDDPSTAAIEPSITDSAAIGENNNHQFNEHGENGVMVTAPTNNVVCIVNSDDEEEIVISYSGDTFPVPMQSMDVPEDFVKQENDRISGSKCFKEDGVSHTFSFQLSNIINTWMMLFLESQVGRRYIVGDGVVLIPKTTVNTFLLWSTFPLRDQKEKDKFMVQMLLLCCLSATDLEQRSVPQAKMIFIEGIYLSFDKYFLLFGSLSFIHSFATHSRSIQQRSNEENPSLCGRVFRKTWQAVIPAKSDEQQNKRNNKNT